MTETTFRLHPSPLGEILIVARDERLLSLHPIHEPLGIALDRTARELREIPQHDPVAGDIEEQLDEYFDGTRTAFEAELDWQLARGFACDALEAVTTIPYGETATYGEVALLAGSPGAARAVGSACRTSPFSIIVPVHRVVRADRPESAHGAYVETKKFLLELEQQEHLH